MLPAAQDADVVGPQIYEGLRARMEATQWGRMVVIDVNSGDYEVADDDMTATLRLLERRPDAFTWGELVGYPAPYYMGGRITRRLAGRHSDGD